MGWRVAFFVGAMLAAIIYFMRLWIPESPRWLMTHDRAEEGAAIVADIGKLSQSRAVAPAGDGAAVALARAALHATARGRLSAP
jgi:hypothetical protein